jgi:hypothetical protein
MGAAVLSNMAANNMALETLSCKNPKVLLPFFKT